MRSVSDGVADARATASRSRDLLWIDCTAGLVAGIAMLALAAWLARWYALPRALLLGMGIANLAYAACSFTLARRARRPPRLVAALAAANGMWAVLCLVAAVRFAGSATGLGLMHLVVEAMFVGGLGALEWARRERLVVAP